MLSRDILIYNLISDKESLIRRSFEPTPLPEGKVPVVVPEPSFEAYRPTERGDKGVDNLLLLLTGLSLTSKVH